NFATLRPRRRHRGRYFLGAIKPEVKLDPGFLEHLRLSSRAVIGPGARFLEFLFTGTPRRRRNPGGGDGTVASTMLRSRRSQRDGGCLPTPCIRWQGHDRSSYVPDDQNLPARRLCIDEGRFVDWSVENG